YRWFDLPYRSDGRSSCTGCTEGKCAGTCSSAPGIGFLCGGTSVSGSGQDTRRKRYFAATGKRFGRRRTYHERGRGKGRSTPGRCCRGEASSSCSDRRSRRTSREDVIAATYHSPQVGFRQERDSDAHHL